MFFYYFLHLINTTDENCCVEWISPKLLRNNFFFFYSTFFPLQEYNDSFNFFLPFFFICLFLIFNENLNYKVESKILYSFFIRR